MPSPFLQFPSLPGALIFIPSKVVLAATQQECWWSSVREEHLTGWKVLVPVRTFREIHRQSGHFMLFQVWPEESILDSICYLFTHCPPISHFHF